MKKVITKYLCTLVLLAIIPAISFAHKQSFAAVNTTNAGYVECLVDTIPGPTQKEESLVDAKKEPLVKKVPKSRRQIKPISVEAPVRPIIKPKIIKPVVKVAL